MKKVFRYTALVAVCIVGMAATVNIEDNKYFDIIKNIEIFTNLYKELNTSYVDDVDPGKLMKTGIDAMVSSLDPFTNYISESDIEGYRYLTEGRYNGIGAKSDVIGDYVTIIQLYKDQPADKAGMKVGDQIVAVDGKSAKGRSVEDVNSILRGFPGTAVTLTIKRPGQSKDIDIDLVRSEVNVPNVPYYGLVGGDVGYVSLTTFTRMAGRNIAEAVQSLKSENPNLKGVVLDLRNNGGGLLNEAVNICNVFINKGELVVTTKGKVKDWDRAFRTMNSPIDLDIPLAVLINKRSASASEIVSGVIQDYDRGVLIGQRSYGKGLVQNTKDVGYNSKLKLTTAKYYIPSQRCIQSVEYKDGEPVDIPDDKRTPFKTRSGRTVLDGGGVSPDIYLKRADDEGVVKALVEDYVIFDYVTEFASKTATIDDVNTFEFTGFDDFVAFVQKRGFNYESDSEKLIKKLEKKSQDEGFELADDIKALKAKVAVSEMEEIKANQAILEDLIEKEIVGRYYYQRGQIQIALRNDKEIDEAITILKDKDRYQKILSGQ